MFSDNTPRVILRERVNELEKLNMLDQLTKLSSRGHVEIQMNAELPKRKGTAGLWEFFSSI